MQHTPFILVVVLIMVMYIMFKDRENFDTNEERDKVNKEWFNNAKSKGSVNYETYRENVPGANIVDYTKYKKEYA